MRRGWLEGSKASGVDWPCKHGSMGWEALDQWGDDVARLEPLSGGVANEVWTVRIDGQLAVGRVGTRSDDDLAWEVALLQHLEREGLTVPVPLPTLDGRRFIDGLVECEFIDHLAHKLALDEKEVPQTNAWSRVGNTIGALALRLP